MSGERAPECFQALFNLLDSTSKILAPWSMRLDSVIAMSDPKDIKIRCDEVLSSFPVESWGFANGIVWSDPERIRIWMVCNVNESMAKELQLRIDRCGRSFILLGRIKQIFSAMDPDKRDEPRMARIMAKCCERCFWSFLYLETFIGNLCAAKNWERGDGASGDGKPLAQQVETKDESSRPEDGLLAENRRLIWGGIQFTLTTNQAMVFRLLVEAYPNDVLVSQFEDIGVRVLRDSFRRKNAEGKNEYDPLWYLIGSGSRKDSKRMVDPKVARNDPRIISQSPT